jgi:hypothetical protein
MPPSQKINASSASEKRAASVALSKLRRRRHLPGANSPSDLFAFVFLERKYMCAWAGKKETTPLPFDYLHSVYLHE